MMHPIADNSLDLEMEDFRQDAALLHCYVQKNSQTAFAALIDRHKRLVYMACLRELHDAPMAEDATQVVFLLLARKAASLQNAASLAGWLFRTARFAARNALRQERRRLRREQEVAQSMKASAHELEEAAWSHLEPLLNPALSSLSRSDQDVIILRYLDGLNWRETALHLGVPEDAAQKRGTRALDRLRQHVDRFGLILSLSTLTTLLAEQYPQSAPLPPNLFPNLTTSVSPQAAVLYQGVLHTMKTTQAAAILGGLALTGAAAGLLMARPLPPPARPHVHQVISAAAPSPQELLTQVQAHYRRLSSFSMTIQHQDSSGLYPGAYTQQLQWRRGIQTEGRHGHFALLNTSSHNKALNEEASPVGSARAVPSFFADGRKVLSVWPHGKRATEWETSQPNIMPGWEVTGGLILSWLQETPGGQLLFDPPQGMTVSWVFGPRTVWQGQNVRELNVKLDVQGGSEPLSLFVSRTGSRLIGFEWKATPSKTGYAVYTHQQEDPSLPATPDVSGPAAPPLPKKARDQHKSLRRHDVGEKVKDELFQRERPRVDA